MADPMGLSTYIQASVSVVCHIQARKSIHPYIKEVVMKVKTNVKAGALYRCVSEA
jgi:hypothetical protein